MKENNELIKMLSDKTANSSSRIAAIDAVDSENWNDVESLKTVMKDEMNADNGEVALKIFNILDKINDARMVHYFIEILEDQNSQDVYRKMALNSLLKLRHQGRLENKRDKIGGLDFPLFNLSINYPHKGEMKITESELKITENAISKLLKSEQADDEMKDLIQRHNDYEKES